MTALLTAPEPTAGPDWAGLPARIQAHNPFLDNRVNAPSSADVDVPAIHQGAFNRVIGLAQAALEARRGLGTMLWGEAGIGKSHLLSRLGRWADGRAWFVYLHNLQSTPDGLPRSLLRTVLSILSLGHNRQQYRTPLFSLIHGAVLEALPSAERKVPWGHVQRAYANWVDSLGSQDLPGSTLLDRSVYEVLFRFFRSVCERRLGQSDGRVARAALRWLSGEALDPEVAPLLGLPPGPTALADNEQVRQVLVALTRLAARQRRPFVLAFDQVDNLDAEQFSSLARFLEALIDAAPNLLVITAGIQSTLLRWHEERVIQDSAWDRLAQERVLLQKITLDEAVQLVRARLQAFLQPFAEQPAVVRAVSADPFFPLGGEWFRQHLQGWVDLRPRDVINRASEGWRALQERLGQHGTEALSPASPAPPPAPAEPPTEEQVRERIDRQVAQTVADHLAHRQREPQSLPPDEDRLMQLVGDLFDYCRERLPAFGLLRVERPAKSVAAQAAHQLVVERRPSGEERPVTTGLMTVTAVSRVSVASSLRRLVSGAGRVDRQILVTDSRVGLRLGPQGENYLQALVQLGPQRFLKVEISPLEYAELDALHSVIGLAHSGELEIDAGGKPRPVTAEEAIDSLQRQGRFRGARLLREVLESAAQPAAV